MSHTPHEVDVIVGRAIRTKRALRGISQAELGQRVGVTFQQIQKYEKGTNRVSASKLYEIACALKVDVRSFFDELPQEATKGGDDASYGPVFIPTREGVSLNRAFNEIIDSVLRKKILKLVQSIATANTKNVEQAAD